MRSKRWIAKQQREVADVPAAHLADDLPAQGPLRQQIREPGWYAHPCAAEGCGGVLEDLTEHLVVGRRQIILVPELGTALVVSQSSDATAVQSDLCIDCRGH